MLFPDAIPVTAPEVGLITATEVVPLLHVPPAVASVSVVVAVPGHIESVPPIAAGNGLTVTTVVAIQPVGNV